jgi:hypothetical protein
MASKKSPILIVRNSKKSERPAAKAAIAKKAAARKR